MAWFIWAGVQLLLFIGAKLLASRLPVPKSAPSSQEPPTAEIGRSIPIVWGTCKVRPNVIFFGNPQAYEFTRKGEFAGYTYHAEIALGICWGPVDALVDIIFDNTKSLRKIDDVGASAVTPALPRPLTIDGLLDNFVIDARNLFGGSEKEGGVIGEVDFQFGTEEQEINIVLETRTQIDGLTAQSAWPRLCYAYFWGNGPASPLRPFYFGTSPSAKSIHFVVQRFPSAVNGAGTATIPNSDGYEGANPAEMIYEALIDTWWGLKVDPATIDLPSFQAAADTLFAEGFGLSMQIDAAHPTDETLADILRYIDGDIATNPTTGLVELTLIRPDYDPDALLDVTPEIGRELEFYRPTYRELPTGVKLKFTNNSTRNFVDDSAEWVNSANREITGEEKIEPLDFSSITDPVLAASVTFREGKALTLDFARGGFKCDRRGFNLRKGSAFRLISPEEGIGPIVCRVTTVDYGSLESGEMSVSFVEDVFSIEGDGEVTGITTPGSGGDPSPPGGPIQVPDVDATYTETDTSITGFLEIDDPDSRVTAVEKRWTVSGDAPGAFSAFAGPPYTDTVSKTDGLTTLFEWRVTYDNISGGSSIITGSHLFGSGPLGDGSGSGSRAFAFFIS